MIDFSDASRIGPLLCDHVISRSRHGCRLFSDRTFCGRPLHSFQQKIDCGSGINRELRVRPIEKETTAGSEDETLRKVYAKLAIHKMPDRAIRVNKVPEVRFYETMAADFLEKSGPG